MTSSPKTESGALVSIPLPLPVDDRNSSIFPAVTSCGRTAPAGPWCLAPQLLSNVLWSAWRLNHRQVGAASQGVAAAVDGRSPIELYVVLDGAPYRYNARQNHLVPLASGRAAPVSAASPRTPGKRGRLQLIYVAVSHSPEAASDPGREALPEPELKGNRYCADTGPIAGKIYLFGSAYGLSAAPHDADRTELGLQLGLKAGQQVLFAQSIGYPNGR